MNREKAKRALRKLARQKGISEGAMRREIEIAIAEGMRSSEPQARSFWKTLSHQGEKPTPEEVIASIAALTKR